MKPVTVIAMIAIVSASTGVAEAGLFRLWGRSADNSAANCTTDCPEACTANCASETCAAVCFFDHVCTDACCQESGDSCTSAGWTPVFGGNWRHRSRHWLRDVCGDVCCRVDLSSGCGDNCLPDFCCETVDSCTASPRAARPLRDWLAQSRKPEFPRVRQAAQSLRHAGKRLWGCTDSASACCDCVGPVGCGDCGETFELLPDENSALLPIHDRMVEDTGIDAGSSAHRWNAALPALPIPEAIGTEVRTPRTEDAATPFRLEPRHNGYVPLEANRQFLMPLQIPPDRISQREE